MDATLKSEFQAVADKGNSFSVTVKIPEVPAVPEHSETVEFIPSQPA